MTLSRFFFLLSFLFFGFFLYFFWEQNNPQTLAFDKAPTSSVTTFTVSENNIPSGIMIPSIHVWLPVYSASINNGNWETTPKGISFLTSSGQVGSSGNSVFYGHNWPNLLGNLKNIRPNDRIQIITKTGKQFEYVVSTVQEVSSNEVSVLNQTNDSRLTLYTCTGFLDSKRIVVVAILQSTI